MVCQGLQGRQAEFHLKPIYDKPDYKPGFEGAPSFEKSARLMPRKSSTLAADLAPSLSRQRYAYAAVHVMRELKYKKNLRGQLCATFT